MSKRQQIEALMADLTFIGTAARKAKLSYADASRRVSEAVDWQTVDNAGNNLTAIIEELKRATKRALG